MSCPTLVNAQVSKIKVGAATKIISPKLGTRQQAAGAEHDFTKIYSDLEANGIYFTNGKTQFLIISCDLVGLNPSFNNRVREAIGVSAGILPSDVIVASTHTHGGPVMIKSNYFNPLNKDYMKKLKGWLIEVAKEAIQSAKPAKIGWGTGIAAIGWNRKFTYADGSHKMNAKASRPNFTGMEGPDDHQQTTLFIKSIDGRLIAIMYNNTTHPTTFYATGIMSSDFPGNARKRLREKFHRKKLPVLFLNGTEGDIERKNPFHPRPNETRDHEVKRLGKIIYKEIMRQYKNRDNYNKEPVLKHIYRDLKVGVRLPSDGQLTKARKTFSLIKSGKKPKHGMGMILAYQTVQLQKVFGKAPFDVLRIHAIRIGDLAIVTEPDELYCQFGLDIKRRSPVKTTMVVGLADGSHGYIPTIYGMMGGGYSGQPLYRTPFKPRVGYRIVETGSILINKLWSTYKNTDDKEIENEVCKIVSKKD